MKTHDFSALLESHKNQKMDYINILLFYK